MGSKIKCGDKIHETEEECLNCPDCFPPIITKALIHGRFKERKRDKENPRFGVSRVTRNCLRQSYYDLVEDVPQTLEKMWIFSRGHAIHEFFQQHMKDEEKEAFIEKKFNGFSIIGFIDGLTKDTLFEFKTTANIPQIPQEHHVLQSQAYFSMLSPEDQRRIKYIKIIYFSMHSIKVFEIPKRNITPMLEANGAILTQALRTGVPPQRTEGWQCDYCDFKDICFNKNLDKYTISKKKEIKNKNSIGNATLRNLSEFV